MRKRIVSFLIVLVMLSFFCSKNVSAQKNIPLIDSYDLLQKGIALADSGQYDKASALYEQISRNDTNYSLALYEEAISRISGGEDSIAIGLCRRGIELNTEYT